MNLEDYAVRDGVESCYTGMYLVVRVTRPEPIVIVNNIDVFAHKGHICILTAGHHLSLKPH